VKYQHTTPAMLAAPLYLHTGSAQRIDLDSADRLRIERNNMPTRHIPLHQVSRMVCHESMDISAKALMACLQQAIPIAIVNSQNEAIGWCLGARRKESSTKQLLMHALDDPQWEAHFQLWRAQQQQAIAAQCLLLCGVQNTASARQQPRVALCNAHYLRHRAASAHLVDAVAALAQHELAANLSHLVGAPDLLAWYRPGLNLIVELGVLLGLYAHIDLHHAPKLPAPDKRQVWAVQHFEKHAAHWQARMGQLLFNFEQFLRTHWL